MKKNCFRGMFIKWDDFYDVCRSFEGVELDPAVQRVPYDLQECQHPMKREDMKFK